MHDYTDAGCLHPGNKEKSSPVNSSLPSRHITVPENCMGCGLCANVCSKGAIRMVWSSEGFLVPRVEESLCVECGLCSHKCPALGELPQHDDDPRQLLECYGAWNRDKETLMKSSSGGVFSALAKLVLEQGGCVFGVVWRDKLTAVFTKAESMEEISAMRGSKYTQALPDSVYRQVKAELKRGRRVLFSGTPCQIHALRSFLGKPYENLLTADIVCHGVPSHLLLEQYVREKEAAKGEEVEKIDFRCKKMGWNRYSVSVTYRNGEHEDEFFGDNSYMRMFLSDLALNRVCYNCPFAHIPRQGDLTLGDFWGVERVRPEWPIREGIASLLVNTAAGHEALKEISEQIEMKPVAFREIYQGQGASYIRQMRGVPSEREEVLQEASMFPLSVLIEKYLMRIRFCGMRIRKTSLPARSFNFVKRGVRYILRRLKNI